MRSKFCASTIMVFVHLHTHMQTSNTDNNNKKSQWRWLKTIRNDRFYYQSYGATVLDALPLYAKQKSISKTEMANINYIFAKLLKLRKIQNFGLILFSSSTNFVQFFHFPFVLFLFFFFCQDLFREIQILDSMFLCLAACIHGTESKCQFMHLFK